MLLDGEARHVVEIAADRGEAELGVLLPIPVGAERREAAKARLARRERRGPVAHA